MSTPSNSSDIDAILNQLTLEEKISLLAGHDFWHTTPLPRFSLPAIRFTDGPNGVRGDRFFNPLPGTCIPCGTALAATWNLPLIERAGRLLSAECIEKGAHVWLGPTVNMIRSPLNGRGFECFSEDPLLSGKIAAAVIRGVQRDGRTMAALKHFVANDQETEKMSVDVRVGERALREIYLKPFEIAVREAGPRVVMASYNRVNGLHTSESPGLLQRLLRDEWGFDGLVMSDWFGTYSVSASLNAGLDLEMPGPPRYRTQFKVVSAIAENRVHIETLDERVRSVLKFINEAAAAQRIWHPQGAASDDREKLNRQLATESLVLLKNANNTLPIQPLSGDSIAVLGPNAKLPAACGGGSASLRPHYTTSVYDGILAAAPAGVQVEYEPVVHSHITLPLFTEQDVRDDNDHPGVTLEFFREPLSVKERVPFDTVTIHETAYQLMDYKHPKLPEVFFVSMRATYVPNVSAVYNFGLATYGVSELYIDDELVIDNSSTQEFGGMFFGKGSAEKRASFHMEAGIRYVLRVEAGSAATSKVVDRSLLPLPGGACRLGGCIALDAMQGIQRAVELARKCTYVLLVAGLNADLEKEGRDRDTMDMPPHVDDLIQSVLAVRPDTVIVIQAGHPVGMPWRNDAQTILHSWYGGNEAGAAVADVVFGHANPSGKLPMSFPDRLQDVPSYLTFGSDNGVAHYDEGIFVGYRYFETKGVDVAFPFGHGLSYTTFSSSILKFDHEGHQVQARISNTGRRSGAEILRCYVFFVGKSRFKRPDRVLAGFKKVLLEPGQDVVVEVQLQKDAAAVWDEHRSSWCVEKGQYGVQVDGSEHDSKIGFEVAKDLFWKSL